MFRGLGLVLGDLLEWAHIPLCHQQCPELFFTFVGFPVALLRSL